MYDEGDSLSTTQKRVDAEFCICDKCRYDKGFHVSLKRQTESHAIVLICPNCGQRYAIGWKADLRIETQSDEL